MGMNPDIREQAGPANESRRMNADVKAKWVEALRSGKYTQGKGTLRNKRDEFCCFGVLCDLVGPSAWLKTGGDWEHRGNESLPHVSVLEQAELPYVDAGIEVRTVLVAAGEPHREHTALDRLNDQGWSFAEIADLIEEQL